MSARRINVGVTSPCRCCGHLVRHDPLGHDEPIRHTDKLIELMRIPMDERMGGKPRTDR